MRKIIIGLENCQKCKMLKAECPDAEYIEIKEQDTAAVLAIARLVGIKSMPFVLVVGEPHELSEILQK